MADWLKLIPAAEAHRLLLQVAPVGTERVALADAAGRVLAEPLVAPHDVPSARLSAMDGYAIRAADVQLAEQTGGVTLRVVGAIAAGSTFSGALGVRQAVSIATGGVVPAQADAVVMVELTTPFGDREQTSPSGPPLSGADGEPRRALPMARRGYAAVGGEIRVDKAVAGGANIIPPGDDLRAGTTVLAVGRRLRPGDLAALATFGVVQVSVFRRPRIAVLATGSEVCPPDQVPGPGQVRDSNQYVLAAEVESAGAVAVRAGIVTDDADLLQATVLRLIAENDGLILSGGSSVGPKDLTARVLGAVDAPGVLFHGIDIRPGKPTIFACAGPKPILGMPGYPTSSMVVFEAFVRPMLARLGGEAVIDTWPAAVPARLSAPYAKPAAREDYLRVRLSERTEEIWAEVLAGGSSAISNVIFSDGLARIPAGVERLTEGSWVAVRRFR